MRTRSYFQCSLAQNYKITSILQYQSNIIRQMEYDSLIIQVRILSRQYRPISIFQRNWLPLWTLLLYDVMSLHFWRGHYQALLVIMAWLKSLHAFLAIMPGTYLPTWVLRTIHILHTCHDKIFLKGPFDDGGLTLNHFMH